MAIITISRGTYSGGKNLAECVAEKLGYRCISREILVETAKKYKVPEEKLLETLRNKPSLLDRLTMERDYYLAYIQAVLCEEIKKDNVVYHGHAGHLLLKNIPHVLKIKVIADIEFRLKAAMSRNNLKREEALQSIKKMDNERAKWTKFLYGVDWNDPSLYDIVINLEHITLSGACEIVCHAAGLDEYKTTPEIQKIMDDLALSTHVKALILMNESAAGAEIEVKADNGVVTIWGNAKTAESVERIKDIVSRISGVKEVKSKIKLPWLIV